MAPFHPLQTFSETRYVHSMAQLTASRHLGRLLIVCVPVIFAVWGTQFLPDAYQPSRPIYMLGWLAVSGLAYFGLRRRSDYLASAAAMLSAVFGIAFFFALFMRN
jgi:hypothetical protein